MHKLCYLLVLHFVIKIALGDNNSWLYHDGSGESILSETEDDNMIAIGKHDSTSIFEQKILQHLNKLEDRIKELTKENKKNSDNMKVLAKANQKLVESMNLLVKENEKLSMNVLAKENQKIVHNVNGLATENVDKSQNGREVLIKDPVNTMNANPLNCMEATKLAQPSGLYGIQVENYSSETFNVYCENEFFGGGWTVIARRMDGTVDFADRNWTEYKEGFGNLDGEFFIGMNKLYALTNRQQSQELIFMLVDVNDIQKYAMYSSFAIGDESEEYKIKTLGNYSGDAGDSFSLHRNQTFKTKDRDASARNCTKYGAWWYKNCYISNLFGTYFKGRVDQSNAVKGIYWLTFRKPEEKYGLKFVQMMIRPRST